MKAEPLQITDLVIEVYRTDNYSLTECTGVSYKIINTKAFGQIVVASATVGSWVGIQLEYFVIIF